DRGLSRPRGAAQQQEDGAAVLDDPAPEAVELGRTGPVSALDRLCNHRAQIVAVDLAQSLAQESQLELARHVVGVARLHAGSLERNRQDALRERAGRSARVPD